MDTFYNLTNLTQRLNLLVHCSQHAASTPLPLPPSPHRSGASTVSSAWNSVGPSYQEHTSGVALSRTLWPCRALMGMKVRSFLGLYPADLRKGVSPLTISSYLCARVGERECVRA